MRTFATFSLRTSVKRTHVNVTMPCSDRGACSSVRSAPELVGPVSRDWTRTETADALAWLGVACRYASFWGFVCERGCS